MNSNPKFADLPVSAAVYGEADFVAVRDILHGEAGIVLPQGKAMLVYSRLAPLVRASGSGTFSAYVKLIEGDPAERRKAIGALTTNHTFFYREAHHFEHFASVVRPKLVDRVANGGRARIWSAGCSSGEETWSLVMTLLGEDQTMGRRIAGADIAVLATDIATHALDTARAATYPTTSLAPVPSALRRSWASDKSGQTTIGADATGMVRFRTLNLLGEWPMRQPFDVVFCRNVMIYFDQATKERLVARFARALAPGGILYIGHSERVTGPAAAVLKPIGNTTYQRSAA